MTIEEVLVYLREENTVLREQLAQRDEIIQQQEKLLSEQNALIQQHGEQMNSLSEQIKALQDRLAKDSHNSYLSPSSDRFGRKPKSLRAIRARSNLEGSQDTGDRACSSRPRRMRSSSSR
jgi:vacuolar-type H+-ATPase subunit I/STV1